jgi:hypothetical protein
VSEKYFFKKNLIKAILTIARNELAYFSNLVAILLQFLSHPISLSIIFLSL